VQKALDDAAEEAVGEREELGEVVVDVEQNWK